MPEKLKPYFGNEEIEKFMSRLAPLIKKYSELLEIIPIYDTIITKNKLMEPLLKQKTILYIFRTFQTLCLNLKEFRLEKY